MMRKNEKGAELVEFAFVIVGLVMLMLGIVDFGRALYTYHFVANAAREATRYASVRGSSCQAFPDCNIDSAGVKTYVQGITPSGIDPSALNVQTSWTILNGSAFQTASQSNCVATPNAPGCFVEVDVKYPFRFVLPFLPTGSVNMESASTMEITQ